MGNKQLAFLSIILGASDVILLNMCLFVGGYLSGKYGVQNDDNIYIHNVLPANALWIIVSSFFRLYEECTIYTLKDIYRATWRSVFTYVIAFQLYALITTTEYSKDFALFFSLLLIFAFVLVRLALLAFENIFNFNFNDRVVSILAISSMGGHWIELLRLMPLFKKHNVTFVSNKKILAQSVEGCNFYAVPDANKDTKVNLVMCFFSILSRIIILRPRVIITTGAAPGLMGILVGRLIGIKTIWIDSIANAEKLSLSGAIASRIADKVYTQWEHLATNKIEYSGSIL